jgi:hypothetical protein
MAPGLMKVRLLPAILVGIVLALALAACGGDDGGSGDSAQTPPAAETPATGVTGGTTGGAAEQGTTGGREDKPRRKRKRQRQQTPAAAEDQQKAPQESASTKRKAKQLAQKIDQGATSRKYKADVSYDAARKLCETGKLKDLRAFYKFKGDDPQTIARAVAKFYKPAFRREAAYNGCIKGLSER